MNIHDSDERRTEHDDCFLEDDFFSDGFCTGLPRQGNIIMVDGTTSMRKKAENGKSKLDICVECINKIPKTKAIKSLTPVERNRIDLMLLSFRGDDVKIEVPFGPLGLFNGVEKIKSGGSTSLYKAISTCINCAMDWSRRCATMGFATYKPQIAIYTDGGATDPENRELAKTLCRKYASAKNGKVKIFVILVPGSTSEKRVNEIASDILDLCDNITVIKADNCVEGLPATFDFFTGSIVAGVSSTVGEEMKVQYDFNKMKVLSNTPVNNGYVSIGTQNI